MAKKTNGVELMGFALMERTSNRRDPVELGSIAEKTFVSCRVMPA